MPQSTTPSSREGRTSFKSPLPPLLAPLGPLFAAMYALELGRRSRAFDRGKGVITFDRPVISVGNLSVGGTGKSPMVRRLVELLSRNNLSPVIAMRGYAARKGFSDEADETRRALEALSLNVPIVAQPNRLEGLLDLFASPMGLEIRTIILDDGFQHRKIARCFDLVLIDATRDPFADHLLPQGWLREPTRTLARAHAVAITHADRIASASLSRIVANARNANPNLIVAAFTHAWQSLNIYTHAQPQSQSVSWLKGKRVAICCAIGNPNIFIAMVREATGETNSTFTSTSSAFTAFTSKSSASTSNQLILPDHDPFNSRTIARLLDLAKDFDALVITDKDWSKLNCVRPDLWPCPVVVPQISMCPLNANLARAAACDFSDQLDTSILATISAWNQANPPYEPPNQIHNQASQTDPDVIPNSPASSP